MIEIFLAWTPYPANDFSNELPDFVGDFYAYGEESQLDTCGKEREDSSHSLVWTVDCRKCRFESEGEGSDLRQKAKDEIDDYDNDIENECYEHIFKVWSDDSRISRTRR